jgi:hypothetical protein
MLKNPILMAKMSRTCIIKVVIPKYKVMRSMRDLKESVNIFQRFNSLNISFLFHNRLQDEHASPFID